jgi:hypothetical protein
MQSPVSFGISHWVPRIDLSKTSPKPLFYFPFSDVGSIFASDYEHWHLSCLLSGVSADPLSGNDPSYMVSTFQFH